MRHCSQVLAVETGETDVMWKHGDNLTIIHISRSWQQQPVRGREGAHIWWTFPPPCSVSSVSAV